MKIETAAMLRSPVARTHYGSSSEPGQKTSYTTLQLSLFTQAAIASPFDGPGYMYRGERGSNLFDSPKDLSRNRSPS